MFRAGFFCIVGACLRLSHNSSLSAPHAGQSPNNYTHPASDLVSHPTHPLLSRLFLMLLWPPPLHLHHQSSRIHDIRTRTTPRPPSTPTKQTCSRICPGSSSSSPHVILPDIGPYQSFHPQLTRRGAGFCRENMFPSRTSVRCQYNYHFYASGCDPMTGIGITRTSSEKRTLSFPLSLSRNSQRCSSTPARFYNDGVTTTNRLSFISCSTRLACPFVAQSC